jgi:hypothetical protein
MSDSPMSGCAAMAGVIATIALVVTTIAAVPARAAVQDPVVVAIDSIRVAEGDTGLVAATFTVRLSAVPAQIVNVEWATEARTADADTDFVAASGVIHFDATDTNPIVVYVRGDSLVEGNETFAVRLSTQDPDVVFGNDVGVCTIENDEHTRFNLSFDGLQQYGTRTVSPAFADVDGDGDPDLPLDINDDGVFVRNSGLADAILTFNHHGSAFCDYDKDRLPDLVVMPYDEPPDTASRMQLIHMMGPGEYEDVAPALGMDVRGRGETAVWGDWDGDGWPDLFCPYYAYLPPGRSFLYKNMGDGTFMDVAEAAGVDMHDLTEEYKPEGASAVDWNGDGRLDLYCASHLFLLQDVVNGIPVFTDVREQVGLPMMFDEGAKFIDYDNDGDWDLYLRSWDGPHLFRNDDGHYVDGTAEAGIPPWPLMWGDSFADVDNDGDLDFLILNIPPPAQLYLNHGDGTFTVDTVFAALNVWNVLSCWADVDRDGDLDAVIGTTDRMLLTNRLEDMPGAASSVLKVIVLDEDSLYVCFGATARLRQIGGGPHTTQTRYVDGGSGYLVQDEYALHFAGLGKAHYSLEVRFPGGVAPGPVVDGSVAPLLADFTLDQLPYPCLYVYRDGRVVSAPEYPAPVTAVEPPWRPRPNAIGAPWPSPTHADLTVPVRLDGSGRGEVAIHDLTGRHVRSLARGLEGTGERRLAWDLRDDGGRRVPSGVYFVALTLNGRAAGTRRVVVLD